MDAKQLKVVLACADSKNVRSFLNTVFVDFDTKTVVATNGHILIKCTEVEGLEGTGQVLIPRMSVELAIKANSKAKVIRITNTDIGGIPYKEVAEKYVNYDRVIPSKLEENVFEGKGAFLLYDWRYLKILEDLTKAFAGADISSRNLNQRMLYAVNTTTHVEMVIMPKQYGCKA